MEAVGGRGRIGSVDGAGSVGGVVCAQTASSRSCCVRSAARVLRATSTGCDHVSPCSACTPPSGRRRAEDAVAAPALMTLRRKSAGEPERDAATSHRSSPTTRGVSAESVSDDPRWNRQVAASSMIGVLRAALGFRAVGMVPTPEHGAEDAERHGHRGWKPRLVTSAGADGRAAGSPKRPGKTALGVGRGGTRLGGDDGSAPASFAQSISTSSPDVAGDVLPFVPPACCAGAAAPPVAPALRVHLEAA